MSIGKDCYILDTNIFVQAYRTYYAFDLVSAFWEKLIVFAEAGRVISIDRVKKELDRGDDDLKIWANQEFKQYFLSTNDITVAMKYGEIMNQVQKQVKYRQEAFSDFANADNADAWIIAYALTHGFTVVTHEKPDSKITRKIPIPNVCNLFSVRYTDTFNMLRSLGIRLC